MSISASELGSSLTCRELVELVTDYFEGVLSSFDRRRFEAHLATCPDCPEYVRQIKLTIDLSGRATDESVPVDARDELLQAFRDWHRR